MIEQESFEEDNPGIEINFRPVKRRVSSDTPLIGRNSWYNDMCRRIPDTNTGTFKDIFRNPYEDGRPLTYFLYPGLSWHSLEDFLHRQNATIECIDRAEVNLENYNFQRMKFIERQFIESQKQKGVETIQSDDDVGNRSQSDDDVGNTSQSDEEDVNSQSENEHSSQSENEQESTTSEDSQSEGEDEYTVLQNEELHEELELERYRIQPHDEDDIQLVVRQGSNGTSENQTCPETQLATHTDQVDEVDSGVFNVDKTDSKSQTLNNGIVHQSLVEDKHYSSVQVIQSLGNSSPSQTPQETKSTEDDDVFEAEAERKTTQSVSSHNNSDLSNSQLDDDAIVQAKGDHSDQSKTNANNQSKGEANNQSNGDASNQCIGDTNNQEQGDASNQSLGDADNTSKGDAKDQSKGDANDQSEDDEDSQSGDDFQSDGTYGSCHSDKENELSDGEHEFIGSYKSDDTYTSCHSDEV